MLFLILAMTFVGHILSASVATPGVACPPDGKTESKTVPVFVALEDPLMKTLSQLLINISELVIDFFDPSKKKKATPQSAC